MFANLVCDPRVLNMTREILGSYVYIHQSRINYKLNPSDQQQRRKNGPLMLITGSYRHDREVTLSGQVKND